MTAEQFRHAVIIAKADVQIDSKAHSLEPFDGYGLPDFEPITVTIEQVARCILYQCAYMFGGWDEEELENVRYFAKKRFIISE